MAAKCNLLRGLTQNGTFFMFSEYAENLTKSYVQENQYRVIPSKYAMLNLNYGGKTAKSVGEIFQNYYENACSCFRKQNAGIDFIRRGKQHCPGIHVAESKAYSPEEIVLLSGCIGRRDAAS